jgi:hypothetical protein
MEFLVKMRTSTPQIESVIMNTGSSKCIKSRCQMPFLKADFSADFEQINSF